MGAATVPPRCSRPSRPSTSDEERARLRSLVDAAGAAGPLAWISTPTPEEHGQRRGDYPLELAVWPGGGRRIAARMDNRGEWLEWVG